MTNEYIEGYSSEKIKIYYENGVVQEYIDGFRYKETVFKVFESLVKKYRFRQVIIKENSHESSYIYRRKWFLTINEMNHLISSVVRNSQVTQ